MTSMSFINYLLSQQNDHCYNLVAQLVIFLKDVLRIYYLANFLLEKKMRKRIYI